MARFTQYAVAATQEALDDAGWTAISDEQKENTASMS